ncbi:bifunctional metallophosphatase/5'-nucleotidase [Buchananella hordeovulneris]|uniref:bifunctional metallophosphatase/5'-nucleotidase n=1 Tax=Buchananella hordeovulneris TaxID=52770 RepID=UPI001639AE96|nr:bifunctional UDP-sugar hydrolase/5'-nucleotidase [Buchananella hordeovulneris]
MKMIALAAVGGLVASAVPATAAPASPAPVTLNLLNITDIHGHIDVGKEEAGAAVIGCYVDKERAAHPHTLFTSAGDNVGGSPFLSAILRDEPTIDSLNLMGLDANVVGNHEFDRGWSDLRDRIIPRANFPHLGANVVGSDLPAYVVKETGGIKVGFVGVVTPDVPTLVTPDGVVGLEFTSAIDTANRVAGELKDGQAANGEADVVVVLVHEDAAEIAAGLRGELVDVVFGGHTHREYVGLETIGADGKAIVAVEADHYGRALGRVSLDVDPHTKKVTGARAELVSAATMTEACGTAPHPQIAEIVARAKTQADAEGDKPVATIASDFYRGTADGTAATAGANRGTESTAGNLLADVALWGLKNSTTIPVDIGLINAGGIRADLLRGDDGVVTYKEAFAVMPFGNAMTTTEITGAEFKQALEQQWQPEGSSRPILKLGVSSNVHYVFDPQAPTGQRITSVTIDGQPLDPQRTYTVGAVSFLIAGGDNFGALAAGRNRRDTGIIDVQLFIDYLAAQQAAGPVTAPLVQRSLALTLPTSGLQAGQEAEIALGSLGFTVTSEQVDQEVTVQLGQSKVTAPIDYTPDPTGDTTGRAVLRLPVPADLSGVQQLEVSTPGGSRFAVPVSVTGASPSTQRVTGGTLGELTAALAPHGQWEKTAVVVAGTQGRWLPLAAPLAAAVGGPVLHLDGAQAVPTLVEHLRQAGIERVVVIGWPPLSLGPALQRAGVRHEWLGAGWRTVVTNVAAWRTLQAADAPQQVLLADVAEPTALGVAAAVAPAVGAVVLPTSKGRLTPVAWWYLWSHQELPVVTVGGKARAAWEPWQRWMPHSIRHLEGADALELGTAVAQIVPAPTGPVVVVNAHRPEAGAAAALVARSGGTLVLTDGQQVAPGMVDLLRQGPAGRALLIVGDEQAVSSAVQAEVEAAVAGGPPPLRVAFCCF